MLAFIDGLGNMPVSLVSLCYACIARTSAAMVAFEEAAQRRRESTEPTTYNKPTIASTASTTDDVASVDDGISVDDCSVSGGGRMGPVGTLVEHMKEQLDAASRTVHRQLASPPYTHTHALPPPNTRAYKYAL